jgi:hypothetical protein
MHQDSGAHYQLRPTSRDSTYETCGVLRSRKAPCELLGVGVATRDKPHEMATESLCDARVRVTRTSRQPRSYQN